MASKAVVSCVLTKFRVAGLKIKQGCVMKQGLDLFSAEILTLKPGATAQLSFKSNYLLLLLVFRANIKYHRKNL